MTLQSGEALWGLRGRKREEEDIREGGKVAAESRGGGSIGRMRGSSRTRMLHGKKVRLGGSGCGRVGGVAALRVSMKGW